MYRINKLVYCMYPASAWTRRSYRQLVSNRGGTESSLAKHMRRTWWIQRSLTITSKRSVLEPNDRLIPGREVAKDVR